jgi:gliding motility-associated-like protein
LRIHPLPIGELASLDTAVCDGEPVPFKYNFTGTAPWNLYFSDESSYTVSSNDSLILKDFIGSDVSSQHEIDIDSLSDGNNCKATNLSGLIKVLSYEIPSPKIISAANVCGDSAMVMAETPKFNSNWRGEGLSFIDSENNQTEVRSAVYDTPMTVIWHEQNNFCSNEDTAEMVFFKLPVLETEFSDTVIYNKTYHTVNAPVPEYDSVTWIAVDDLFFVSDYSATFADLSGIELDSENQLVYRIDNGVCFVTDTMNISILDILSRKAFTPNEDGVNDYFYIEGLEDEGVCKLAIINLWGNVVFQSENTYDQTLSDDQPYWDGRDEKDRLLPDGTYYYILETGVSKAIKKGYVIIKGSRANGN